MSSLCSAHFGKNIFRISTRKVPKKEPPPTSCVYEEIGKITKDLPPKLPPKRYTPAVTKPKPAVTKTADEVYGFLPGQEFGSTPSLARSCRSLASSRASLDKSFNPHNTEGSGHSSGYGSESSCSPPSGQNSPTSVRSSSYSSSSSGCSSSGSSSSSSSSRYPKNNLEVAALLEAASLKTPANMPMIVSRGHTAPADWTGRNEVSVRHGMIINALFKSFEWVYVRTPDGSEGYIPLNCIRPIGRTDNSSFSQQCSSQTLNNSYESLSSSVTSLSSEESMVRSMKGQKRYDPDMSILESMQPRRRSPVYLFPYPELDCLSMTSTTYNEDDDETASVCSMMSSVSVASSVFSRYECAELTVLFDYTAMDQDDISVRKHETVTLLNDEDPDWIWIQTTEGREGFIPRTYAADLQALNLDPNAKTTYF